MQRTAYITFENYKNEETSESLRVTHHHKIGKDAREGQSITNFPTDLFPSSTSLEF